MLKSIKRSIKLAIKRPLLRFIIGKDSPGLYFDLNLMLKEQVILATLPNELDHMTKVKNPATGDYSWILNYHQRPTTEERLLIDWWVWLVEKQHIDKDNRAHITLKDIVDFQLTELFFIARKPTLFEKELVKNKKTFKLNPGALRWRFKEKAKAAHGSSH